MQTATRASSIRCLRKRCRNYARGRLSTELYVPAVSTTTLKQMIVGLRFPGLSSDDLATGCQQFLVAYAGKSHHLQVTAASSSVANQLAQGDQSASLADIRTICEGEDQVPAQHLGGMHHPFPECGTMPEPVSRCQHHTPVCGSVVECSYGAAKHCPFLGQTGTTTWPKCNM